MLTLQNLKIFLRGAFVDTDVDRRLCMTGCAYRVDLSYQIDCGFILKMTHPNSHTVTTTQQIQAELSSSRTEPTDRLRFPAFRVDAGPNLIVEPEDHSKPVYLQSALNKKAKYDHPRKQSQSRTTESEEPAKYLDDYYDP